MLNLANPLSGHGHNNGLVGAWYPIENNLARFRVRDIRGSSADMVNDTHETSGDVPTPALKSSIVFTLTVSTVVVPSTVLSKVSGGKLTFAVWIKPSNVLSYKAIVDTANRHLSIFLQSTTDLFVGVGGFAGGTVTLSKALVVDEWNHLVLTSDGTNVYIYVNGTLANTNTNLSTSFSEALHFGDNPSGGGNRYLGKQTGWAFWNRCMPAGEVSQYYAQAKSGYNNQLNFLDEFAPPEASLVSSFDAEAGSFTMTGNDAFFDISLPLEAGSFAMSGNDASFDTVVNFEGEAGSFTMTGNDAFFDISLPLEAGSFAMTGSDASIDHAIVAEAGSFVMTGNDATFLFSGVEADETTHAFIGTYKRGTRLPLHLHLIALPNECPVVDFWLEGTTLKKTVSLPKKSDTNFSLWVFLDGNFTDGHYVAAIRYTYGASQSTHYRYFKVAGGDPRGQVVGIQEIRRPLGRAVVQINENGSMQIGYNPRVEQ